MTTRKTVSAVAVVAVAVDAGVMVRARAVSAPTDLNAANALSVPSGRIAQRGAIGASAVIVLHARTVVIVPHAKIAGTAPRVSAVHGRSVSAPRAIRKRVLRAAMPPRAAHRVSARRAVAHVAAAN